MEIPKDLKATNPPTMEDIITSEPINPRAGMTDAEYMAYLANTLNELESRVTILEARQDEATDAIDKAYDTLGYEKPEGYDNLDIDEDDYVGQLLDLFIPHLPLLANTLRVNSDNAARSIDALKTTIKILSN